MRRERGLSGSVQVSLLLPFVVLVFLLGLQWAMVTWAQTIVRAAAQDGARAASAAGGTVAAGKAAAVAAADNGAVTEVQVHVVRRAESSTARVTAKALAVVPLFPTLVTAEAHVPIERLTRG